MLRHIVFFSVKESQSVERVRELLSQLATIPAVRHLEVQPNIRKDQLSSEVALVVYAAFEDDAAREAYKPHPIYAETTRILQPLRGLRPAAHVGAERARRELWRSAAT